MALVCSSVQAWIYPCEKSPQHRNYGVVKKREKKHTLLDKAKNKPFFQNLDTNTFCLCFLIVSFNSLGPKQSGRIFADNIFKCISLQEIVLIRFKSHCIFFLASKPIGV